MLILDSFLLDNYNLFCVQEIVRSEKDSVYLINKCSNSEGNGIHRNSSIKRKKDSIYICGKDTLLFEHVKNLRQKQKIKSVSLHILNKPIGFPYSSIKVDSNRTIFLDGVRTGVLIEKTWLLNIVDFIKINHEYEDNEFTPGNPIVILKVLLEDSIEKELKLFGWNKAPLELQILLMYLMGSSYLVS
ncbi:hypothetical protein EYV94_10390 [Puteibacter caeruleilacunae]|nr:hypothetical protein EYV94_10390 [Puteibacter caeruleilacunae]